MKTLILSYLLHCANRSIKDFMFGDYLNEFYYIKDKMLKRYGRAVGYDIQHIRGKKCNSCGGTGQHPKYSFTTGKIYDYEDCYRCWNGWYKMPIWVCLERVKFGRYLFHQPLKREEHIGNPFTKNILGWEVSTNPVIEGYIEHQKHRFGFYALVILFLIHKPTIAKEIIGRKMYWKKVTLRHQVKNVFDWRTYIFWKPVRFEDDLPF